MRVHQAFLTSAAFTEISTPGHQSEPGGGTYCRPKHILHILIMVVFHLDIVKYPASVCSMDRLELRSVSRCSIQSSTYSTWSDIQSRSVSPANSTWSTPTNSTYYSTSVCSQISPIPPTVLYMVYYCNLGRTCVEYAS